MLPRGKSIFHLGDEGEESRDGYQMSTAAVAVGGRFPSDGRCSSKLRAAPRVSEGLRILIQQQEEQHVDQRGGGGGGGSHVVIKSTLIRSTVQRRRPAWKVSPEMGVFLKACFLCKKELSSHDDVYMYRGDQGYCSEECRCRQILLDEGRELKTSTPRGPSHGYRHRTSGSKIRAPTPQNGRILVAA